VMALLRLRERYDDARLERASRRALDAGDGIARQRATSVVVQWRGTCSR
jgi:hypothetical protein